MRVPGQPDTLWAQEDPTATPSWPPPVPLCLCVLPHNGGTAAPVHTNQRSPRCQEWVGCGHLEQIGLSRVGLKPARDLAQQPVERLVAVLRVCQFAKAWGGAGPLRAGTASDLDSAVRYRLAGRRKMQINQLVSLSVLWAAHGLHLLAGRPGSQSLF